MGSPLEELILTPISREGEGTEKYCTRISTIFNLSRIALGLLSPLRFVVNNGGEGVHYTWS